MDSVSGKTFPTINPVTEEKICDVAEGDIVSMNQAIKVKGCALNLRKALTSVL